MDYLGRGDAPFTEALWGDIDRTVTDGASQALTGRRMIPLYGPIGGGANAITVDQADREEAMEDGVSYMRGRRLAQIPMLYEDFWLYWRDLAYAGENHLPEDLSGASLAAQRLAKREDHMIFYGLEALGLPGLLTAEGTAQVPQSDWSTGEGAFTDVAAAVTALRQGGKLGKFSVLISLDLYAQLQRMVPGTGIIELDRIKKLSSGGLYTSDVLRPKTAAVVCGNAQYMDLVVGQDIRTAYTETVELNHHLRVMETALFRLKDPGAVVLIK